MNNRLQKKLRNCAGETIAETLVGVLIAALALTMLAGAVSSAFSMISKSETTMNIYYGENESLSAPANVGMTVTLMDGDKEIRLPDSQSETGIQVKYSINDSFSKTPVAAYILYP